MKYLCRSYRAPRPFLVHTLQISIVLIGIYFSLSVFANTAFANTQGWHQGNQQGQAVTMMDLIPRMSSGQAYSERYTFAVDLDGGGHIGIDFTISNLGIRSGYGAAAVRVKLPGQKHYDYSERVSQSNWQYAKDKFLLDIANTRVEAKGNDIFALTHQAEGIKVELEFKNTMPIWRPGSGEIKVTDGYYQFHLIAPRATVQGRVQIAGQWHEVTGTRAGYADHVATNLAPYDLATRFSRFRHYNDDFFIVWREIQLTSEYGGKNYVWLVVGYKGQIIFEDVNAKIRFADIQPDAETGYRVPQSIQIDGTHGNTKVTLVLRGEQNTRRDLLENYGIAARLIASRFSKPYQYRIQSPYSMRIEIPDKSRIIEGRSNFTIDFLNL